MPYLAETLAALAQAVPVAEQRSEVLPEGVPYRDYFPEWDARGNRYPPECRTDLSGVKAATQRVPLERMAELYERFSKKRAPRQGIDGFVAPTLPRPTIYLNEALSDAMTAATTQHERCHVLRREQGKDVHWHPDYQGGPLR